MTAAAQLETTFAGAERAERQYRTGRRNVGQGRGHDQDHDSAGRTKQVGLPAAPSEAGEQRERGPRSAPELAPRAEQCAGDAAAVTAPVVPVASHAVAQNPGAGHAGALLPRPELNGHAALFPAPSCAPVPVAVSAAPSSDEGPAPQLLRPTNLPASTPEPVVAPAESRHTASRAPESLRDDPFAELSPGPLSAAPLLHPQRQRELIEQAAGMSTRQVASLLAAAAPEVAPPRDTLRAVAPDRYTLKVSIDQECEQGLRLLKDLMSHVDPRMSWGHLVARLVREAVARHDPRGGGSGHRRRRSAGSAGVSPRRAPKETPAAGAAAGPAQRVDESSRRAPNRTRATGVPAAPVRRGRGTTPPPPGDTAATERQNPIAMLASAAPPRLSGATSGSATEDAAVIAIRSPGAAAPLPICCRSTTCCQSPRGVARSRPTWFSAALLITACATATDRRLRRSPRCSASSALLARRSTALADSLQMARRGHTSQRREPSVHLRYRLFSPGRSLSMRSCKALSWSTVNDLLPLPAFAPPRSLSLTRGPCVVRCCRYGIRADAHDA